MMRSFDCRYRQEVLIAGFWWEVDGIEPLARRDRVYDAATAPACPYWHFPKVLELAESRGLDPHTSRCLPVSNGCRTPVRLTFRNAKDGSPSHSNCGDGARLAED